MCVLLPTLVLVVLLIEYSMLSGPHALASSQSITGLVDFLYSKALTLSLAHPSHHSTADCLHTIYPSTIGFTKISKHNWKIKEQDQDAFSRAWKLISLTAVGSLLLILACTRWACLPVPPQYTPIDDLQT